MLANRRGFIGHAIAGVAATAVGPGSGKEVAGTRLFDVTRFGAIDAVSEASGEDSTNAIVAAVDALGATPGGGTLYFPAGTYIISREIRLPDMPVRIVGDGPELSRVVQTRPDAHGFVFAAGATGSSRGERSRVSRLELAHIGLLNRTRSSGAAVHASWRSTTADTPSFVATDVSVVGATSWLSTWAHGIVLENCGVSRIHHYTFQGDRDAIREDRPSPFAAKAAIRMLTTDAARTTGLRSHIISSFACSYANRAIDLDGEHAGISVKDFDIDAVGIGVCFEGSRDARNLSLESGRISAREHALSCSDVAHVALRGVDLCKDGASDRTSGFDGSLLTFTRCSDVSVASSGFSVARAQSAKLSTAIAMSDCNAGEITSCRFTGTRGLPEGAVFAQIRLEGRTNRVLLTMNNFAEPTQAPIFLGPDARYNNVFGNTVSGRFSVISVDSSMAFNASASNTMFTS